jgi:two-component system chemotaxis response regulator CheB
MEDEKHLIVGVGASGSSGLRDMRELISRLPERLPATILCTLHRPPDLESALALVLQRQSNMEIKIASNGEGLRLGCCYIGLPARHLTLAARRRAHLVPHLRAHRGKTVDLLFDTIAAHAGDSGMGIVLAGSLGDGSRGIRAIKLAGGAVFARATPDSALLDMPARAVAHGGPLHLVGEIAELAREIVRRCGAKDRDPALQQASPDEESNGAIDGDQGSESDPLELKDRYIGYS